MAKPLYQYRDKYTLNNREIVISLRDVQTKIQSKIIHKSINLDLYKGEILCLIGGSGAGKSFLLRNILQLHTISQGCMTYATEKYEWDEKFYGVLFQDGALFSSLNVYENIIVPLKRLSGISAATIKKIVEIRLLQLGLNLDDMEKYPSELSGGMRKRVGLARALSAEPRLLFLDEPTSGLDPISTMKFNQLIKYLQKALNLTILMVTHDKNSLKNIADRVAVLFDGEIIIADTLSGVKKYDHPWIEDYFFN